MKEAAPKVLSDGSIDFGEGRIGPNTRDREWANNLREISQKAEDLSESKVSWLSKVPLSARWGFRFGAPALTLAVLSAAVLSTGETAPPAEARENANNIIVEPLPDSVRQDYFVSNEAEAEGVDKPSVRAVYLVPADKEVNPEYAKGIENAMKHIQEWYADHLGNGKSFHLDPNVLVVNSAHSTDWFVNNSANNTPFESRFIVNAASEVASHIQEFYEGNSWVIMVDSDSDSMQSGAFNVGNAAILDADFLRGLSGEFTPNEGQGLNTVFGNVGSVAHELGHTFGLVHPENACNTDPCLLMRYPFNYPVVELDESEISSLSGSPFFSFQYKENADFQVEVKMHNLTEGNGAAEQFLLNEDAFMNKYYSADTDLINITYWLEPGENSIEFQAFGSSLAHTYGFKIYIGENLVYDQSCGEAGVVFCRDETNAGAKVFNDVYKFEVQEEVETPTFTPTNAPTFENTPTRTPEPRPTPTEQSSLMGDVNCDEITNSIDAALILQRVAGIIDSLNCDFNADTNFDGTTSAVDAALILQLDAGLIDRF